MLARLLVPPRGALGIAPPAAGRTCARRHARHRPAAVRLRAARCCPVLAGARPELTLFECCRACPSPSGSSRSACCSRWSPRAVDRQLALFHRLHARQREKHQTRFYVCFALALACTMGIAFAANLLTLFLFYEVLTLITYPLVTHHGTTRRARRPRLSGLSCWAPRWLFLLPAVISPGILTGTTEFRPAASCRRLCPAGRGRCCWRCSCSASARRR
jgi:multicomponent Na+:H+ antiporter subunit D